MSTYAPEVKVPLYFRPALLAVIYAAFFLTTAPTFLFAQSSSSFGEENRSVDETHSHRKKPKPTPPPTLDAERDWASAGTDFNTGANWVGGIAPGLSDVAWFKTAQTVQPNLSASLSIAGLYFQSATSSGYDITRTNSAGLTLTGYAADVSGAQNSNATAAAIGGNNTSGTNTIDVPLALAPASGSTSTFYQAGGGTLIVNGGISGFGIALTKVGAGTLILTAGNSWTGGTTIGGGILQLSGGGTISGYNLNNYQTTISAGTLIVTTGGSIGTNNNNMVVGANNGDNGSLVISGGTVSDYLSFIGQNAGSSGVGTVSSGTWNSNSQSGSFHYPDFYLGYYGNGTLNLTGSGVLNALDQVIIAANAGSVGTLNIGTGGTAGTLNTPTMDGGSGTATVNFNHTGTITFATQLTGSIAVNKLASGTTILTGANSYAGGTTLTLGTLQLSGSGTLGATTGSLTINGGTLDLNATSQGVSNLTGSGGTIVNNGGSAVALTIGNGNGSGGNYAGVIADHTSGSGTIALTKTGTGMITLSGANSYSGGTTINAGVLSVGSSGALGTTGLITLSGGTLQYSASNNTDYSNRFSTAANQAYNIDTNAQSVTFATALTSSGGSLTKIGTGTLTLSRTNTFTGGTIVNGGTLQLSGAGTLGSTNGALTINTGGTLDLNATSQSVGKLTGSGGTIVNNGNGAVTLTIGSGNGSGGNYAGVIADHMSGTGTIALTKTGGGTITLSGANTYTGVTTISGGILNIQNATALGTTAGGTTVNDFATLQMQGGITVGAEALTLSGVFGTLENVSGTNNYGGLLTLGTANAGFFPSYSKILSDAGTLNLTNTGTITGTGSALYLSGAGSGSISSILGMTSSYLIKDGTGTWTLSGANTYNVSGNTVTTFGTSIYDGTLKLSGSGTLGNTSNGLLIDGGAGGGSGAPILDLNGTSLGVGNLDGGELGSGGTIVNNGGGAVTLTIGNGNGGGGNYSGVIADHTSGAGSIALTKTGTGTIALSGANTYSGATTISAGILNIQNATALGTTTAGTTVSSGATLQIQNNITVGAEALNIRGTGASGATGALENVSGTNNYSGLVTLGAASTISSDLGSTLNLTNAGTIAGATFGLTLAGDGNGSISSIIGTTSGTLTKNGFGTWTLLGANTYTGATIISSGILNIRTATGLGTTAGGTTVNDNATLQIQGGITVGAEALTLSGTFGTLENVSGTNNYGGLLTLGPRVGFYDQSIIQSDAGTLNLTNTGTVTGADSSLELAGAGNGSISSILAMTNGGVQMAGTGTWTLSGANTYVAPLGGWGTIIDSGTLKLSGSGTLGNINNGLLIEPFGNAILDLNGTSQGVGNLTVGYGGTILNNGGSAVTLTIGNGNADGGSEDSGAVIADHTSGIGTIALNKTGTGTMTLSGANTYSGVTTISGGILNIQNATALGTTVGGTTVSSGATLQIQGGITVGAEALTISGVGASGANGALESIDGNNYGGLLKLAAASTISSDAGTLNLTNVGTITGATFGLTLTGGGNGSIASIIGTTSGTLTTNSSGTWTLSGANTYTGGTTVSNGTLKLSGAGTLGSTSGALTVNTGGTLDLNATSQGVGNLTGNGSTIVNNGGGAVTLTIGTGNGGGGNYAGVIADNNNATAGAIALTKTGTGTITLSGANTYSGATAIGNGTLNIQNATALGATTAGTTVSSGATLQIQNNITVGAEALTISGVGETTATGALENVSGTNNYGGLVTLGAATTISSDAGTLNLTNAGTITGATFALTLTGAGNGSISSIIGTTSGTVTKTGVGTWTLSGANTYTGATAISNGILNIQNATSLGTTAAGTTVTSGATLQIQGGITVGAEALSISGVGETTATGALENVSGTNNYGGLVTLGAASTISSDAGTLSLTNAGTITGAGFGLTLTGAGNGSISSIIGTTSGTVTKTGTGTWTLSGANTYTGATAVSDGILNIQNATALGTTAGNTTVSSGATLQIQNNITVGAAESLTISGVGETTATGALENFSGTNNYGGLVTLGAASTISSDAGTLNLTNAGTISGATFGLTLTGPGNGSIASIIGTTTGTLTKNGLGTWTLSGANTYTGITTVAAGTLQFAKEVSLYNDVTANWTATKIIVAGTLALNVGGTGEFTSSDVTTLVGLGTATGGFKSGSSIGLDTTNAAGGNFTYSTAIANPNGGANALGLTKLGAGTLTLSAANTYTGGTIINAGTLLVNGGIFGTSSGTGTGAVTVSSGGTLGGSGAISGAVTVNSGGHLAPGNSPGILHTGALTLASGSFFNVDLNGSIAGSGYDQVIATSLSIAGANLAVSVGGTLNIGDHLFIALDSGSSAVAGTFAGLGEGATFTSGIDAFTISYVANGDGGILANDILLTVTAIPEPSTWLAGAFIAVTLLATQRRRFVRKAAHS